MEDVNIRQGCGELRKHCRGPRAVRTERAHSASPHPVTSKCLSIDRDFLGCLLVGGILTLVSASMFGSAKPRVHTSWYFPPPSWSCTRSTKPSRHHRGSAELVPTAFGVKFPKLGGGDAALLAEFRQMSVLRSVRHSDTSSSLAQLRLIMIAVEREAVITMRDRNEISDTVMRRLLSEFDHEKVLLGRQQKSTAVE